MVTRFAMVALCSFMAASFDPRSSFAMTTGQFMTTPQIREAIEGRAIRLKTTVYGFFENGKVRISKGYAQRETTWTAEAGSLCLADVNAQGKPDPTCAKLWKDNLTGKFEIVFDKRPGDQYGAAVRGIGNNGYESAVEELREELLKGTTLTDAQRQIILADQTRYRSGFVDPPLALGEAYKKYIAIKRCYDERADYEYVYVTERDMEYSKSNVINIEKYVKSISPTLNTKTVWDDVVAHPEKFTGDYGFYYLTINNTDPDTNFEAVRTACQELVSSLANTYKKVDPNADRPKKDF